MSLLHLGETNESLMRQKVSKADVDTATDGHRHEEVDADQSHEASRQYRRDRSSTLFAERNGHSLKFEDIVMKTKTRDPVKNPPKEILKSVSGHVPPRKVTAIMGPSGSGKTSLLKVLTGRAGNKQFDVSGQVKLDGRVVDPTDIQVRRELGYVEQEISILSTSTPREAIRFSARLRLDRSVTNKEIEDLVDEILAELGLVGCADTMIGGGVLMSGGLSGGEKKRTQCGVELVTKPDIIILDEPTSGLDSFTATQLVDILGRLSRAGAGVLLTIHQPPPTVVRKIDHLILLQDGRLMYDGSVGHQISDYFTEKGHPKPEDYNIADWILVRYRS
jgi:ABC-type multidrug transport system ATPase subunit